MNCRLVTQAPRRESTAEQICVAMEDRNGLFASDRRPDLVLMDIQLPVLDGYDATRQIKALPGHSAIPIIAVSSFAMKGDEEKARAAGCDHYVTKPYSPVQLLRVVRDLLAEKVRG